MGAAVFPTSDTEAAVLTDDPDDPSRQLVRQILGAVAQFERSIIALRLRAGRAKKANDGGFAFGSPPYGWQAVDGELVSVPEEQGTLADIQAMRDAGKSYREVAAVLNAAGIKPRRGRAWHPGVLNRLVDRSPP
jgi:DNA invertase Pin-like site-specific DNA recombinase